MRYSGIIALLVAVLAMSQPASCSSVTQGGYSQAFGNTVYGSLAQTATASAMVSAPSMTDEMTQAMSMRAGGNTVSGDMLQKAKVSSHIGQADPLAGNGGGFTDIRQIVLQESSRNDIYGKLDQIIEMAGEIENGPEDSSIEQFYDQKAMYNTVIEDLNQIISLSASL